MENKPADTESIEAGHETKDVHARGVWFTALGIVVVSILIMLAMVLMFRLLQRRHNEAEETAATQEVAPSVLASAPSFPQPRLQVDPQMDLATFRAREDAQLNDYGWIDKNAGVVRIPIDQAINLIVQRGLPFRGQPGAPAPARTVLDMQQARPSDWAKQQQQTQQQEKQEQELRQEQIQQQEQQQQQQPGK